MTSEQVSMSQPPAEPFEYMLYEGDPDHLKTIVSSPRQKSPRINPDVLKLMHRIGRGPFGDVWIATYHLFSKDYDEHHEVAVKVLNSFKEDQIPTFLTRFDQAFVKCQGIHGTCLLQGVSVKMGKVCIAMKFYEGSVGDKMAQMRGGKLPLADVLRYGIDLALGIKELHSRGILVLNVKPCNALIDQDDRIVLGDFGIPLLLLGLSPASPELVQRLGTPKYMAPEQWEPEARGPVAVETDSWGLGCCLVEMLTGSSPWSGCSAEEVQRCVVLNQKKPEIPGGLPPLFEDLLHGCFEYDLRERPSMGDILRVLQICKDEEIGGSRGTRTERILTDWSLLKDQLQIGDVVRSRKPRNSHRHTKMLVPEGTVVGVDGSDGNTATQVVVRVHGVHGPLRLPSTALERVSFGFAAGDCVRIRHPPSGISAMGILHSVDRAGSTTVGAAGSAVLWHGSCSDLEMAAPVHCGQFVRLTVTASRFARWPARVDGSLVVGRVQRVLPNGCLVVNFPGLIALGGGAMEVVADPAEVEVVSFSGCKGIAAKYRHLEDYHWAVRPVAAAAGLLATLKLGFTVAKVGRKKPDQQAAERKGEGQGQGSNPAWLPPPVANILFREAASSPAAPSTAATVR
ncbi:protein kinase superfamily protein [Wolffia australiana]